jgi:iron-sulfur cluster repair protein YtfE (RIC family)
MAEHKTMNTVIHAAFRRDLRRFDDALAVFPPGSQQRAEQLGTAWDNLDHQLRHHHEDEETIFWPALRELGADGVLVGDLGGEHERMLRALESANATMLALRAEPTAGHAESARKEVATLREVLEEHLAHEERDLEPFTAQHRSSPQIKASVAAVRKRHKGSAGTFFAWLADDADDDVKTALRKEVPAPVLKVLVALPGRDYRKRIASVWS